MLNTQTGPQKQPEQTAIRLTEFKEIERISGILLEGQSLNDFNRQVLTTLLKYSQDYENELTSDKSNWETFRSLFLSTILSQNYQSPAPKTDSTVFQGGLIQVSDRIKYMRSEMNTQAFGEGYDRNTVLIQSKGTKGFTDLAAKYITHTSSGKSLNYRASLKNLAEFIKEGQNNKHLIKINIEHNEISAFKEIFRDTLRSLSDYEGGLYLSINGVLSDDDKTELQEALLSSGSNSQLLIDEAYDPFNSPSNAMRKISFIHNQKDSTRYQLLQDAASMGFRPTLKEITEYCFGSKKLDSILNLSNRTEDSLPDYPDPFDLVEPGKETDEQHLDYQILIQTLGNCQESLKKLSPTSELADKLISSALEETENTLENLQTLLNQHCPPVKTVSETFHKSYYRLRSLLQHTAMLVENFSNIDREEQESRISMTEEGLILGTDSGMTAIRLVVSTLADKVNHAYSCPHYWETDFLVQNAFGSDFHYPEVKSKSQSNLTEIRSDATKAQIKEEVDRIVTDNINMPDGQLLCFDKSIAPFFYTQTFRLEELCKELTEKARDLKNPIYLVVDNTLDFDTVNTESLFPEGIPKNIFLIFTPSCAKLHQLGLDMITGGLINIHSNPEQQSQAFRLYGELNQKLEAEGSEQSVAGLQLLQDAFYSHFENNSAGLYTGYMLDKRYRNTNALITHLVDKLNPYIAQIERGSFEFKNPETARNSLFIPDPKNPDLLHEVSFSFHYDPNSCIHSYVKIDETEPVNDSFIAGPLFEEIKKRIFQTAAEEGIHLADGTSWGFNITRMDWYMHTLRIATGLEHQSTMGKLGRICGSVFRDLLLSPDTFLS